MSNQKNIFDFFRKQYEEKSNQDQGWNTPPDFVFEDAISQVNTKKTKKKRVLVLLLLAGFILSSIVATNLYFSSRINTIEQKVAKLPILSDSELGTVNPESKNKKVNAKRESISSENDPQQKRASEYNPAKTIKSSNNILLTKNNTRNTTTKQKRTQPNQSLTQATKESAELSSQAKLESYISNDPERKKSDLPVVALLPSLVSSSLASGKNEKEPHRQLPLVMLLAEHSCDATTVCNNTIGLTLLAKHNYSSLKMQGPGDNSQSLTLYDKYYSGYGTQLNVQIPVKNNVSLLSSISYDKLRNKSLLSSTMLYNDANEYTMISGMAMYSEDNEISTPMGELQDRMRFEVDPSTHPNGTAITQNSDILQSMTMVGLQLGPQFNWINCDKLQWSSALQIGVNYVNKMLSSVNSEYKILDHTMNTITYDESSIESMKKISSSLSLSTYINYQLNESYSVTGGISTMRSLSSLRSAGPSTKLINWSSQIGISRKF